MESNLNYLLYGFDGRKKEPLGVISEHSEVQLIHCNKIPETLSTFLIEIEDKRYRNHNGIDYKSIARAIIENFKHLAIVQGGSTITQQLARNILRNNKKTFRRKAEEYTMALQLEKNYSKDEILNLYFQKVYWGANIYGIRGASISYFRKEPNKLNQKEQIQLLALLRGPNLYSRNSTLFHSRYRLLVELLAKRNVLGSTMSKKLKEKKTVFSPCQLSIIRPSILPYIKHFVDHSSATIFSTINVGVHREVQAFIKEAKYPTSLLLYFKGNVIAFGSTYGSDYPFKFQSNVGSSLKPFVYCFLRANGIDAEELISTKNTESWPIREVNTNTKPFLTLSEALLTSNNNVFINASEKIGMSSVIAFLAELFRNSGAQYPSSILGATANGISLNELASTYHHFFCHDITTNKEECLKILNSNLIAKTGININNGWLKTGTTNNNRERFALFGNNIFTVGLLRQQYYEDDYSKEGNFIEYIREFLNRIIFTKKLFFSNAKSV